MLLLIDLHGGLKEFCSLKKPAYSSRSYRNDRSLVAKLSRSTTFINSGFLLFVRITPTMLDSRSIMSAGHQSSDNETYLSTSSTADHESNSEDRESNSSTGDQSPGSEYYESDTSTGDQSSGSEEYGSNSSTGNQSSDSEGYEPKSRAPLPFNPNCRIELGSPSRSRSIKLLIRMNHHDDDDKEGTKENNGEGSSPLVNGIDDEFKDKLESICQGLEKAYSGNNEKLPNLPAYHPSFANVERICDEIYAGAAEMLRDSSYQDKSTESLLAKIRKHRSIVYPPAKRIGFLGDSGVGESWWLCTGLRHIDSRKGKSSLINSILDTPGLAAQVGCISQS